DIVLLAKPVTLTEGDRVTLTTDVPVATDGTSKPEKLLYAVSVPPVHGQIEHINYPGVPIPRHSRLDVVAQKVPSIHDNSHEAGKEPLRLREEQAEPIMQWGSQGVQWRNRSSQEQAPHHAGPKRGSGWDANFPSHQQSLVFTAEVAVPTVPSPRVVYISISSDASQIPVLKGLWVTLSSRQNDSRTVSAGVQISSSEWEGNVYMALQSRLKIKWSKTELHKTSSCAHENVGTGGKDRLGCEKVLLHEEQIPEELDFPAPIPTCYAVLASMAIL
ncbi:hypothetical protein ASZ78_012034, partial [Callipepla squamata]